MSQEFSEFGQRSPVKWEEVASPAMGGGGAVRHLPGLFLFFLCDPVFLDTRAQDFLLPTHTVLGDGLGLTSRTPAATGLGKDLSSNLISCHLRGML